MNRTGSILLKGIWEEWVGGREPDPKYMGDRGINLLRSILSQKN